MIVRGAIRSCSEEKGFIDGTAVDSFEALLFMKSPPTPLCERGEGRINRLGCGPRVHAG